MTAARPPIRHLVVVHYHLRPGGVRRIIELALPILVTTRQLDTLTLLSGEPAPTDWRRIVRGKVRAPAIRWVVEPAFAYASKLALRPDAARQAIRAVLDRVAPQACETLFWVQNPGLARNLLVPDEMAKWAVLREARLLFHHHDFWFENRWDRWPEMGQLGFRTLQAAAKAIFPSTAQVGHLTINRLDHAALKAFVPQRVQWLPNLVPRDTGAGDVRTCKARRWLNATLGDHGPVWLCPTRFLRRKNLAESVLLTRWLRPEAWLVTTAGVSSPDEAAYAQQLKAAARRGRWRVRFCILEGARSAPGVDDLVRAAEVILLTSAQEGFGLPYLEAAAAGRPLIARRLPQVSADLATFGFRFPCAYDEIFVAPELLDLRRERERQGTQWRAWRATLPACCRPLAQRPWVLTHSTGPVPFSRLTLCGQLEVLRIPPAESLAACQPHNTQLAKWKRLAQSGRLPVSQWPQSAARFIGHKAYADRFWAAADSLPAGGHAADPAGCQRAFIQQRLGTEFLYPILFGGV